MSNLFLNIPNYILVPENISFIWSVYIPILIWMLIMLVIVLILIFRYPLGKYYLSGQAENPYKAETMGIPRGVIRGVLTLTILFGAVILQVFIVNSESPVERIAPFMTAFEIMLGFYFGSKVVHHLTSADKNKVKAVAKEGGAKKEEFYDPEATG